MSENHEKSLTPSEKADRLWSKLKARAADLKHGRLNIDLIIRNGEVERIEVIGQHESLIAD